MARETRELYGRAARTAKKLASKEPQVSKLIRTLLKELNRKDRLISEWRSGRMAKALTRENESLRSANSYLRAMLEEQATKR